MDHITVNTRSDQGMAEFFRNAGSVQAALSGMRDSMRSFGASVARSAAGFARLGDTAKGLLSSLMHASSVAEGLESGIMALYKWGRTYWGDLARSLDSLATSARYLRNSLAAMAAPLIDALAPAIDYVTDRLAALFNLIGQLFARLTGSETYVAARKTADAWDSVRGRITRATSALKRYIGGFDQLTVLTESASGDSGSGSGGGGGSVSDLFETRTIDSGLSDFADALRAAFEASDWLTLGTLIGDKVNEAVDSVDWAALGGQVGHYVNALFSTAYWTLERVNFQNIGASAAQFLNAALAEVDFSKVGGTAALLVTSFYETLAGFIAETDWQQLAGKLAEGIDGFVTTLDAHLSAIDWAASALKVTEGLNSLIAGTDWGALGSAFGGRINDLLAVLGTASANFDWAGAGRALADSLNGMLGRIDWQALGSWLNDAMMGALDMGLSFVERFDAEGFGSGFAQALSRVDWGAVASKLWELLSAALKKLGEFVSSLLFGGSVDLSMALSLIKKNWKDIAAFLGFDPDDPVVNMLFNLLVGQTDREAKAALSAADKTVTTTEDLAKGTEDPSALKTRDDVDGTVTQTENLKAGQEDASAKKTRDSASATVTKTQKLVKGSEDASAKLTRDAKDSAATLTQNIKKGSAWNDSAYSVSQKSGNVERKLTQNVKKGAAFNDQAYSVSQKSGNVERTLKQGVKRNGWSDSAYTAATKSGGTTNRTLEQAVKKSSSWSDSAFTAAKMTSGTIKKTIDVGLKLASGAISGLKKLLGLQSGGLILNGVVRPFAAGGVLRGGLAKYLHGVPHYASGTTAAHGTVFVAGEAGPEIMGHINGRTEILNKSQIAEAMYAAVTAGTSQAAGALGSYLARRMEECGSAVVSGLSDVLIHAPAVCGGAMPYDVAAAVAASSGEIRTAMDENNEDLIQTIIQVAGQLAEAIRDSGERVSAQGAAGDGISARRMIGEINRQARMFGGSPLLG